MLASSLEKKLVCITTLHKLVSFTFSSTLMMVSSQNKMAVTFLALSSPQHYIAL